MSNKNCELGKIFGAVAVAGAVALFSSFAASTLYAAAKGEEPAAQAVAGTAAPAVAASATPAPAASDKPVDIAPLLAKADVAAGEQVSKKCAACHTFTKGRKNGVGPNQFGLVGRSVASVAGFSYSPALTAMKDKKWTAQNISDFLAEPKKFAAGTKMAFAGIKDAQERANLIAYLNTLK